MAKDARQLREVATAASSAGKHKKALECYAELEKIEPRDAQWPKRIAETQRKLGLNNEAIAAFERAADKYAQNGFLVQALAVCKLILQIDANHAATKHRLASMNDEQAGVRTRIDTLSDNHPALQEIPAVAALRARTATSADVLTLATEGNPRAVSVAPMAAETLPPPVRAPSVAPPVRGAAPSNAPPRQRPNSTGMPPSLPPRAVLTKPPARAGAGAIDSLPLSQVVAGAHELHDDGSTPGISVIPLGEKPMARGTMPLGTAPQFLKAAPALDEEIAELDAEELDELDDEAFDESPAQIRAPSARRTLEQTALFGRLRPEALADLVATLELIEVGPGEAIIREGDVGDALYVVADGEVAITARDTGPEPLTRLRPGTFFGEIALLTDAPRTATATATQATQLLKLDRNTIHQVIATHPEVLPVMLGFVRDRLVDKWTRTSPLFGPMPPTERRELADRFQFLEINAGTPVIQAGTKPEGLYIVLAGYVAVTRQGAPVALLGAGELLGEAALLGGGAPKTDATAKGKCLALLLPASVFRELMMTHPHVLEYVGEAAEARRALKLW